LGVSVSAVAVAAAARRGARGEAGLGGEGFGGRPAAAAPKSQNFPIRTGALAAQPPEQQGRRALAVWLPKETQAIQ